MAESEEVDSKKDNFFFDTYAVIEILAQNPNYEKYKNAEITITIFNLAEIYYICLGNFTKTELEKIYNQYKKSVVEISDEVLKEAISFRKEHKKQSLSYTDCIGYIYAKRSNMKFLTGDKEFENLENVEFVK